MNAVMLSVRPEWCALIANGEKTVEVRKTRPKIETPFKVYIYCTNGGRPLVYGDVPCAVGWEEKYTQTYGRSRAEAEKIWDVMNGRVIGEFVCDEIIFLGNVSMDKWEFLAGNVHETHKKLVTELALLTENELLAYASGKPCYGWHISDLVIYDEPRELSEFYRLCDGLDNAGKCWECDKAIGDEHDCGKNGKIALVRPPQSWCYVEVSA